MKPLNANDYLTEHIDHEECAALLVLEPLDVVDRTSKHQAWSRSPLNTGNGKAKLFHYGMLCFVAANFGPTNGLSTYGRSGVHEEERGEEAEKEEEG